MSTADPAAAPALEAKASSPPSQAEARGFALLEGGGGGGDREQHRSAAYAKADDDFELGGETSSSQTSAFLHSPSHTSTPRSRQGSPMTAAASSSADRGLLPSPLSLSQPADPWWRRRLRWLAGDAAGANGHPALMRGTQKPALQVGARAGRRRRTREIMVGVAAVALIFFLANMWMVSNLHDASLHRTDDAISVNKTVASSLLAMPERIPVARSRRPPAFMYSRLLALAAHALAEGGNKPEPPELWKELLNGASSWTPCADQNHSKIPARGGNGYILISANGGINQQRVAICNAVAITQLLNATLVIPKFQYNSVWRDRSQFGDIYQEEYFIGYLKDDIQIVKELPVELQSLDLEAVGSLVTDTEVMKEAKPSFFLKHVLPILLKNRVVHFVGFGNRLAFDPIPFEMQRLRCRCNFHALQFVEKIQEVGSLLVQRMHKNRFHSGPLEHNLLGAFVAESNTSRRKDDHKKVSKYLAVHLRFEIDMAAYSLCYFGGGKEEEEELEAFRRLHFPVLTMLKNTTKVPSAASLRADGQCPLTPEEAVLMLAALGFKRKTRIYLAGAHIYGGKSRMAAMHSLYPNIVTKEKLLSPSEIKPFLNYSSQLAALDFIACAAADAFAMTDSGSQFSSLVSGYRMYYASGRLPNIKPNKRRLASVFLKNNTIEWRDFERSTRKAIRQTKRVLERPIARSIYRHPRCLECMCKTE